MEVAVVAEPDLEEPCELQILLNATGSSSTARVGLDAPLFRHVPQRVADMRRLLVEVVEYVRSMPRGDTKAVVWVAVMVREHVTKLLGDAFGFRMMAVYTRKMTENEKGDLVEACAAFLLEHAQRLTEEQISPGFPLPMTWTTYYEHQPDWEWPNYDD
jgi:hypothetical protein